MPQSNIYLKEEYKPKQTGYNPSGEELKVWKHYQRRKNELMDSRSNISGMDLDAKMRTWDKNYFNRDADIPASELDANQKPIAINNAFGKVQTALSVLISGNPKLVLDENNPRFSGNRELIRSLAEASWRNTNSLGQFKLSVFNMAKRGWMAGRTYNKKLVHEARFPMKLDDKGKIAYESRMVKKMDDVAYMNLNNHYTWIDEESKPEDMYSTRDWCWYENWHIDALRQMYPEKEFPNMKYVMEGGVFRGVNKSGSSISGFDTESALEQKKGMTGVFFYEDQYNDYFIVEINGVMVVWEPLPQNHKRISLVTAPWSLRSAETIYGIGIVELMEREDEYIDRILNMDMRQLLLTISPPGFYSGTEDFEDENIKLKAGVLRRTLNPKDINWLQIPEGNQRGLEKIEWLQRKQDSRTGVDDTIAGGTTQRPGDSTAYELGINREASLKRLQLPVKSLQYALDWEFKNRVGLIQQIYSDFDVEHIANEEDIMNYMDEIQGNPDFYYIENEGKQGEEVFYAKKFREFPLNLEQDDKGKFVESEKKSFFKIKPEHLPWEGQVTADLDSLLVHSEELEKADTLRLGNLLFPLFQQDPAVALKPAKQLLQAFKKDPKKWFPDSWLQAMSQGKSLTPAPAPGTPPAPLKPETVVPERQLQNPGIIDRISSAFNAFKKPNP